MDQIHPSTRNTNPLDPTWHTNQRLQKHKQVVSVRFKLKMEQNKNRERAPTWFAIAETNYPAPAFNWDSAPLLQEPQQDSWFGAQSEFFQNGFNPFAGNNRPQQPQQPYVPSFDNTPYETQPESDSTYDSQTRLETPDDSANLEITPEIDTFQQSWEEPVQVQDDIPAADVTAPVETSPQTWVEPAQVPEDIQLPEANNPTEVTRLAKVSSLRGRFRPRHHVAQQSINESYLRNFPEAAAPEGSDVPMEEQLAIKEALFEIKKEKRNRF